MQRRNFVQLLIAALVSLLPAAKARATKNAKAQSKAAIENEPLLLLETTLAGFQYYLGEALFHKMQRDDELTLKRDPLNPYDKNAIAVQWRGNMLGYLPQASNLVPAQMMDRGEIMQAKIKRLTYSENAWERIEMEICWRDANQQTPAIEASSTGDLK